MKYFIVIAKKEDGAEGLFCTENGIVLKKNTAESGEASFRLLTAAFPMQKAAVYLSDVPLSWPLPKAWRFSLAEKAEMLANACFPHEDGYLLSADTAVLAVRKEGSLISSACGDFGSRFVFSAAFSHATATAGSTLCYLFETATGLPKTEMEQFLNALPEKKRFSYARVVRQGCELGDKASLQIREKVALGYAALLRSLLPPESVMQPLYILGMPKADKAAVWAVINENLPACFSLQGGEMPPLYGGVLGAATLWHIRPDASFVRRFLETYALYE